MGKIRLTIASILAAGALTVSIAPPANAAIFRVYNDCSSDHWLVVASNYKGQGKRALLRNCQKSPLSFTQSFYNNPYWPGDCWVAHVNYYTGKVEKVYTKPGWNNIRLPLLTSTLEVMC